MSADEFTPVEPPEPDLKAKAEKRVKEKVELLQHIATYIIVNGFLVIIWALTGSPYPWFLWVMAGWGLGLAIHIVTYFTGKKGDAMRDRMIDKEMERLKKEKGQ